ncbi:4-alpha-glucanotransferase [Poriferisphaera corsica]|uniref:4-alpha-glucanotransferase n=1 Tax=Poriferisphaera corsica TaxID=2528020 RepID=A0A517YUV8_9BACT|nr:4-alpha-glucanotransferase [Poriferisphaera corsica]QDU33995.1 4-alpha-glucanotransferase [Poriferisphaera corsica]
MRKLPQLDRRSSGILMHPTSLPGKHGSGDLGQSAYDFVDFLNEANQAWWQMLPIGPVDGSGSPYNSTSAFAGSYLLISLVDLVNDGLLTKAEIKPLKSFSDKKVFYPRVMKFRADRLGIAFERFIAKKKQNTAAYKKFLKEQKHWLPDYTLFCAIKDAHESLPWWEWPKPLAKHKPEALVEAREEYADGIAYHTFIQFIFHKQWMKLKKYANSKGISLVGDIPIFIAHDSADVWSHTDLFDLKANGLPREVSGAAPDAFSDEGQLWGHPLYLWDRHKQTKYKWWIERFKQTFSIFDSVRIDHFLGFARFWAVKYGAPTARNGKWRPGPGPSVFNALKKAIGNMPIIAEDLGILTPQAAALRDQFNFPGMRIIQFAFGDDNSYHAPHNFPPQSVVYTGTHDNDTTCGWWVETKRDKSKSNGLTTAQRTKVSLGSTDEIHWDLIRLAMSSPANLAVFPVQDLLGLDGKSRMNLPGTIENNWAWRLEPRQLNKRIAKRLAQLTDIYGRTQAN